MHSGEEIARFDWCETVRDDLDGLLPSNSPRNRIYINHCLPLHPAHLFTITPILHPLKTILTLQLLRYLLHQAQVSQFGISLVLLLETKGCSECENDVSPGRIQPL
jgi:hypothetical protein